VPTRNPLCAIVIAAAMASACAQTPATDPTQLASASAATPGAAYTLSDEEQNLDCKALTGRTQVRILELRGHAYKTHPSELSQSVKSMTAAFSTSGQATGADAQYARDRARLDAYNRQLAAQKCATFDLDKELQARPSAPPPSPIPSEPKKPSAKKAS
jgi:hypothetical protein